MDNLKRDCYAGKMPGIKKIWYAHVAEVASVIVSAKDTVSVTLKQSGHWGEIEGKRMFAESAGGRSFNNTIRVTLPGWTTEQAVGIGHLTTGRYIVKFIDRSGQTWIAGYGTPLHLTVTESAPETPLEYQGIELIFSCESEFPFLKST